MTRINIIPLQPKAIAPGWGLRYVLRRLARRCDVHDVACARRIAELEVATGQNRRALDELYATGNFIAIFDDPDLTDCGRWWCRERRGLA